jgi:hypothetical protein
MTCKYFDSGWCYAPEDVEHNSKNGSCIDPLSCPYNKENKTLMTTQKDDLVFEIQELQTEIDEHVRKINQLKSVVSVKEQQLKEMPITLQRIIEECMFVHKRQIQLDIVENILDRVEVEMFPKKFQYLNDYNEGWNDCIEDIKARLRE